MRGLSKVLALTVLTAVVGLGFTANLVGAGETNNVAKFCENAVALQKLLDTSSIDPDDPDSIKAYARKAAKGLKKVAKSAPTSQLRKDLKTIAKGYAKIAKSGDLSQNTPRKQIDAELRLQDYARANCEPPASTP